MRVQAPRRRARFEVTCDGDGIAGHAGAAPIRGTGHARGCTKDRPAELEGRGLRLLGLGGAAEGLLRPSSPGGESRARLRKLGGCVDVEPSVHLASGLRFAGFRFPPEVIAVAVRWYLRYGLSYRDVEELLAERGVEVDYVTVYRWVQRSPRCSPTPPARPRRHATGDRWFVDETYVKVAGTWRYLYWAVDQFGQVIDVLLSEQRDTTAARRFFRQALRHGPTPVEVTTDKAGPIPAGARRTRPGSRARHRAVRQQSGGS